jgi:hypothetical protein
MNAASTSSKQPLYAYRRKESLKSTHIKQGIRAVTVARVAYIAGQQSRISSSIVDNKNLSAQSAASDLKSSYQHVRYADYPKTYVS